jgi:hypothetical protein
LVVVAVAATVTVLETTAPFGGEVIVVLGDEKEFIEGVYVARSKKLPVVKVSSASTVKVVVVALVGVPEMTPVEEARERPGGREPL